MKLKQIIPIFFLILLTSFVSATDLENGSIIGQQNFNLTVSQNITYTSLTVLNESFIMDGYELVHNESSEIWFSLTDSDLFYNFSDGSVTVSGFDIWDNKAVYKDGVFVERKYFSSYTFDSPGYWRFVLVDSSASGECRSSVDGFVEGLSEFGSWIGLIVLMIVGVMMLKGIEGKAILPMLDGMKFDAKKLVVLAFFLTIGLIMLGLLAGQC